MKKKLNILAISPHADDVEIAMGGTIAKYVDEGHNVTILTAILPNENKSGKLDKFMNKNRIIEQRNSAKILGVKVDILGLDPYDFSFNRKYIKIFDKKINEYKPDIIFSCWEHDTHQDHKTLAKILYIAARKNQFSLYMYEPMIPGGFNTKAFRSQKIVNISKYMGLKEDSIRSYNSVFGNKIDIFLEGIRGRCRFRGERIGVKYAEGFRVVKEVVV